MPPTAQDFESVLRGAGASFPSALAFARSDDPPIAAIVYEQYVAEYTRLLLKGLGESGIEQLVRWLPLLDFASRPIGSGPFRYDSLEPGEELKLVANGDYFAGPPVIPEIVLVPPSLATVEGPRDVDLVVDAATVGLLPVDDARIGRQVGFGWYFVAFNLRPGNLFVDLRLRQAFALCLDRPALVSGHVPDAVAVDSFVHPASWAHDPTSFAGRDVAAARLLIEAAGWTEGEGGVYEKAGRRLSIELWLNAGRVDWVALAMAAAPQLGECGIEMTVMEGDFFFSPVFGPPGPSDVGIAGLGNHHDPDGFDFLHSSRAYDLDTRVGSDNRLNLPAWSNPEADELLEEGRAELDPARRLEIYRRLQELVREELPYLPLYAPTDSVALASRVYASDGTIDLDSPRYWWNIEDWVVPPGAP